MSPAGQQRASLRGRQVPLLVEAGGARGQCPLLEGQARGRLPSPPHVALPGPEPARALSGGTSVSRAAPLPAPSLGHQGPETKPGSSGASARGPAPPISGFL